LEYVVPACLCGGSQKSDGESKKKLSHSMYG
jgi:hypothetical protein